MKRNPFSLALILAAVAAIAVLFGVCFRAAPGVEAQSAQNPILPAQVGVGPKLPALGRFQGGRYSIFQFTLADGTNAPDIYRGTSSGWVRASQASVSTALATTTPIDISTVSSSGDVVPYTPTQSSTINAATMTGTGGRTLRLIVTTSGTTSYTITFGTNFKTTGTLATGTVSGKVFVITFVSDGVNWNEQSRTAAM
jgi:hypothetical protein